MKNPTGGRTHPLMTMMGEKMFHGLKRKSITTASRWACEHRVMGGTSFPGPWTFKYHPWLREMHDSNAISSVGMKSAQMGFTEVVLNITFKKIDIDRVDCLYILPAKTPDASDFSASRFDSALELSPYLNNLFSDVKNVGHKRAGATNLYIRGSKSRSGLKSIPAGFIVFDELAEMDQDNIPLAMERASGQIIKQDWKISTPTIEDANINVYFKQSTMEHFLFKCPHCSRHIELKFPESIVITATHKDDTSIQDTHLICYECKGKLDHESKPDFLAEGRWVPQKTTSSTRGFYINQLYSSAVTPPALAESFLKSQSDATAETEFYNSKLGLPHAIAGAQINEEQIRACIGGFRRLELHERIMDRSKIRTMGVDVGRWFHIEICEWDIDGRAPIQDINLYSRPRVIWYGKQANIAQIDDLMRNFFVIQCVMDANPERRVAFDFANRFYGHVKLCFYGRSAAARQLVPSQEVDQAITVDRTSWMDLSLGRFHRGQNGILLPQDVDQEYMDQIKAPVREYVKDKDGNPVGRYTTPDSKQDHYAHSRNYCEIALALALGSGVSQSMQSPV